jgi:hypothetical protein
MHHHVVIETSSHGVAVGSSKSSQSVVSLGASSIWHPHPHEQSTVKPSSPVLAPPLRYAKSFGDTLNSYIVHPNL